MPVKFSVRGRDLASTIAEAQAKIAAHVRLPYDTHLEWGGEINQLRETTARLLIIIPVTLLMITFLVYGSVKNARDTLIVLLGAPVAASGGVVALFLTGTDFSISAAVGFISILGVSIQDGLLVATYAQPVARAGRISAICGPPGGGAPIASGAHVHLGGHARACSPPPFRAASARKPRNRSPSWSSAGPWPW